MVTMVEPAGGQAKVVLDAPPAEPDYKALLEQETARREKIENDLRSLRGIRQKRDGTDVWQQALSAQLEGLSRNQAALLKATLTGNTEGLEETVARNTTQAAVARATTVYQRYYNNLFAEFESATLGDDGQPLVDLAAARARLGADADGLTDAQVVLAGSEEFSEAWRILGEAAPKGPNTPAGEVDYEGLARALGVAHRTGRKLALQRGQVATEAAVKKAAEAAKKKALDDAEALDLGSGRDAGGGGGESPFGKGDSLKRITRGLAKGKSIVFEP